MGKIHGFLYVSTITTICVVLAAIVYILFCFGHPIVGILIFFSGIWFMADIVDPLFFKP